MSVSLVAIELVFMDIQRVLRDGGLADPANPSPPARLIYHNIDYTIFGTGRPVGLRRSIS